MCVILVAVASSGSEIIEEDPGGPPGNKSGKALSKKKIYIEEGRKSEGVLVILPFSSSEKRL